MQLRVHALTGNWISERREWQKELISYGLDPSTENLGMDLWHHEEIVSSLRPEEDSARRPKNQLALMKVTKVRVAQKPLVILPEMISQE